MGVAGEDSAQHAAHTAGEHPPPFDALQFSPGTGGTGSEKKAFGNVSSGATQNSPTRGPHGSILIGVLVTPER